jgi:raffinose/stachyose/melibiose transport system substrate-binding protein
MSAACTGAIEKKASAESTADDAEDSRTVLRLISSWGGVDSKAETLKDILSQFEKNNPEITVANESVYGEDFLTKLKTDFASGNDPDVFGLWPGSDINALVKAGKVADLTELLSEDLEWKRSFNPDMWDYTTMNARIYGLPLEVIFECMFVNKDLFEKYNIPIPKDYSDLKYAVIKFQEHGIDPIAFNTYSEGTYLYQNLVAIIGGKNDTEYPFENGKVKQCYITALQYVKDLYDMGAFPKECLTMTSNERNVLFQQKKAAMIMQGSWFIGNFAADDDTVDIIPVPYMKNIKGSEGTMVYGLGGGSFHMSTEAEKDPVRKEASVKLLKHLTSPAAAAKLASETGMISNVNIDSYNIQYRSLTVKGKRMLEEAKQLVGPVDSFVDRSSWEDDIAGQLAYFLLGKTSAETVWENAIRNGIIP